MLFNKDKGIVWVWGDRVVKGKGMPPISDNYTYEFQIMPVNGYPRVTHYDAYKGHPTVQQINQRGEKVEKRYYTEEQQDLSQGLEVKAAGKTKQENKEGNE